jgi:hypothetical protein
MMMMVVDDDFQGQAGAMESQKVKVARVLKPVSGAGAAEPAEYRL